MLFRAFAGSLSDIDEAGRSASFVAATEAPVETYGGVEVLRMRGVDLSRYTRNPVFLDSHNFRDAGAVIGRANVSVVNEQLLARVTYAGTPRADNIWQLVKGDFLRAVSIGYDPLPEQTVRVKAGVTDGGIIGPAVVVNGWRLYEISQVGIPADEDALRRSYWEAATMAEEKTIKTPGESGDIDVVVSERRLKLMLARKAEVLGFAPKYAEEVDDIFLRNPDVTVEEARQILLAIHAKRLKPVPVSTPPPGLPSDSGNYDILGRFLRGR